MRKRILTAALALVMCLGLALPAFAANDLTGNQIYGSEDEGWGNGPNLTLKGVTAERIVEEGLVCCYDVAVGGSLTLEMPFPAGKHRAYTIMVAAIYASPDFTDYTDYPENPWELPAGAEGGFFDETSGKTQYAYHFTEADMGQVNGYDKVISAHIYWDEASDPNADYADDYGSVWFYIRVVPAQTSTPSTPAATAVKTATATPTASTVLVNGAQKAFDAYNINGSNYFKLRDLAYVLSGSEKQFEVGWDGAANAISLTSGQAYTAVGGEMATGNAKKQTATLSTAKIILDGKEVSLTAYNISGNNYFKLRDVGQAFDFGIGWDGATQTITMDTSTSYTE